MLYLFFSGPVSNLIKWKVEQMLLQDLKDFVEDETFVIVKCTSCAKMCSVEEFGFSRIIPGMPVFCTSEKVCSNCMDQDKFLFLTSKS